MTNCEILAMLQPVLNEGLFREIKAVFDREEKQSYACALFQDALKTAETGDAMYERRKAIQQEDRDYSECKRDLANHGILTLNRG
jgi:hypothetical protein